MFLRLSAAIFFAAASVHAQTCELSAASKDARTPLVELFTSEGCSSCPPAERWMNQLASEPGLWRDYVPLALHVDYWDYIGWPDRFAERKFSDRQRRYAREGGVDTVYTPGMFVDGRAWNGWRRETAPSASRAAAGVLLLDVDGRQVSLAYRPIASDPEHLIAHVALLGFGLQSDVMAGENRGRTLNHEFVVLGLEATSLDGTGARLAATLALPETDVVAERLAVAAWVSSADAQRPLQSVGGFLVTD